MDKMLRISAKNVKCFCTCDIKWTSFVKGYGKKNVLPIIYWWFKFLV